jgi:monofunctional biosynthetic peptidoglycan transglycosylase
MPCIWTFLSSLPSRCFSTTCQGIVRIVKPTKTIRILRFFLIAFLVLGLFSIAEVLLVRFINPPFTTSMVYNWLCSKPNANRERLWPEQSWRPIHVVSLHLIRAVQAGEDQKFVVHYGFDFEELNHALNDLRTGKRVRGASTISMQAARTVFLWPSRSFVRKFLEAYYTLLLEVLWDKRRILEVYLNTVDWGIGIVGAEAAAQKYFHVSASSLSPSQAALLAAILPAPHTWSPLDPSEFVRERQRRIMMDMEKMPVGRFRRK